MSRRLLVINVAALSPALATRSDLVPNLSDLIADGAFAALKPVLPATTIPMQATLTTGALPSKHGMIANGLYERDAQEVHFWHQPNSLVQAPRFWEGLGKKVAMLFWQNSKYGPTDVVVTPHPIHTETGEAVAALYTKPAGLNAELVAKFGPFPLHKYWGPIAGIESSQWIAKATLHVMETAKPDLTLTYLPHLDYNLQRLGPSSKAIENDVKAVDALIGELAAAAKKSGAGVVVLSEYGMSDVTGAIEINRIFRKRGWIGVRDIKGTDYLELGDCKAFALVDHQVAHVYLNGVRESEVVDALPGVKLVQPSEVGLDHERAGDLVAIAPRGQWFTYYWWEDDARAPTFARTVDIHRKPGYDPCDLFFDPVKKCIPIAPAMVKGSHGRPPESEAEMGVFAANFAMKVGRTVEATEVAGMLAGALKG